MPRIGEPTWQQQIEAALSEFAAGFRRSRRGNLWREYDDAVVTVFGTDDEQFGWCIARDGQTQFSKSRFETEDEAIDSLWSELTAF
jgi:hypothetical protein